jgi:hypothetical protein
LTIALRETLSQRHPVKPCLIPEPQKLWDNKCLLF